MNDFIIFIFIFAVLYFILNSAGIIDTNVFNTGISCFKTRHDSELERLYKWENNGRQLPKLPALYLEGMENSDSMLVNTNVSPLEKIVKGGNDELDNYGDEPLTDRLNTISTRNSISSNYSDDDLLKLNLSRNETSNEEKEMDIMELQMLKENEYLLDGVDINNKIARKLKKNNQMSKKNMNSRISLISIRDDMELDYVNHEDEEPWWSDNKLSEHVEDQIDYSTWM